MISEREDGLLKAYGVQQEEITELRKQLDAAKQRILDYESEIGAVCPEDFSLKETIGSFKRELSILQMGRESLLRRAEAAEAKLTAARDALVDARSWLSSHYRSDVAGGIIQRTDKAIAQIDAPKNPDAPAAGPSDTEHSIFRMHAFEPVGGEFPNTCRACACFRWGANHIRPTGTDMQSEKEPHA